MHCLRYPGILLLLGTVLLTACSGKDKETLWGTYQEPVEPVDLPEPVGASELDVMWKKNVGAGAEKGFAILEPAYGPDGVYAASRNGSVHKLDRETGKTLWRQKLDEPIFSGVATDGRIVVVSRDDGVVEALAAGDGEPLWQATINRQISSVPAIGKGRVVVRTADGLLVGLDAENGESAWIMERSVPGLSVHGDPTPVISGDAVLTGLANGRLVACNVVTGREYWDTELSYARGQNELERLSDADSRPLVASSIVYTATYQDTVAALQLQNAAVKWKAPVSSRLPMALDGDRLFVTDTRGEIVAIDAQSGEILWRQESFRGRGISQPLAMDGRVIIGDAEGNVYTLDAENGNLLETLKAVKGSVVSLVPEGKQFLVFSSDGSISALSLLKSLGL